MWIVNVGFSLSHMCIEHVVDERGFFWEALEGDEGRGLEVRDGVVGDDAVSAVGQCSGDNAGNRGDNRTCQ